MANKVSIAILGCGTVGSKLIENLMVNQLCIDGKFSIVAVANSKKIILQDGITNGWKEDLKCEKAHDMNIKTLIDYLKKLNTISIVVDCTNMENSADLYCEFLKNDINVVTCNKKAFGDESKHINKVIDAERSSNATIAFESTVGAGLPILNVIKDIILSGDKIIRMEGILSGTLSFIFNSISPNSATSFSEAINYAYELGFSEPDPRDDLCGRDFARKVIILSRLAGFKIEPKDVEVENLVPESLRDKSISVKEFLSELNKFDCLFTKRLAEAHKNGKSHRYSFFIDQNEGISVKVNSYQNSHIFTRIGLQDNIISIFTSGSKTPTTILGPGAGAHETALGLITDIIGIMRTYKLISFSPLSIIDTKT